MQGVVRVKREKLEASAASQAQLRCAQEALVAAAVTRRSQLQELQQQMKQIADKMLQDEEAAECSVCFECVASTALNPCGE